VKGDFEAISDGHFYNLIIFESESTMLNALVKKMRN